MDVNERHLQERDRLNRRHAAERQAENERLHEARVKEIEDARLAKIEEARQRADEALTSELRDKFFMANPGATPADFERLLPGLKDEVLVRRALEQPERDIEAARASGQYRTM